MKLRNNIIKWGILINPVVAAAIVSIDIGVQLPQGQIKFSGLGDKAYAQGSPDRTGENIKKKHCSSIRIIPATFIVNQNGIVYQKDLGEDTASIAAAMHVFNPNPDWSKVE